MSVTGAVLYSVEDITMCYASISLCKVGQCGPRIPIISSANSTLKPQRCNKARQEWNTYIRIRHSFILNNVYMKAVLSWRDKLCGCGGCANECHKLWCCRWLCKRNGSVGLFLHFKNNIYSLFTKLLADRFQLELVFHFSTFKCQIRLIKSKAS